MASLPAPLRVLFLAAEASPFIKVGGLGDVAGSLPRAIRNASLNSGEVDIRLAIPLHPAIDLKGYAAQSLLKIEVPYGSEALQAEVFECHIDGLCVYLIGGPILEQDKFLYTGDNARDAIKFTFFSLAALMLVKMQGWKPHVVHANDWHTAPAIYSVHLQRKTDQFFKGIATLLSLHNLPFLGQGAASVLSDFGLPPGSGSSLPWWARELPLPLALWTADHIVAVSPNYAKEILTPAYGSGLHEFLATRASSISGILNGIDTETWNPATDQSIVLPFDAKSLVARKANRRALLAEFDFNTDEEIPLLGMVSRLDNQKGVDLALEAFRIMDNLPGRVIILGTGLPEIESEVRSLAEDYPAKVRCEIRFDQALSRRIYAGTDILLIPSRYEPCGLAQMIAMRYGCVPVARATGGLRDTIRDIDESRKGSGFLFYEAHPVALAETLRRALNVFHNPQRWSTIQRQGMLQDFSWERSARQYIRLYKKLIKLGLTQLE
jgi:starch synthase